MVKKQKTGGRSRPRRRDLFRGKKGAEPRRFVLWFSARLKQTSSFLQRNRGSVKGGLIFASCIILFMSLYSRMVDADLLKPYCSFTASATGFCLNIIGMNTQVVGTMISSMDFSMGIIDICTGLIPMAILTSAVLAYPATVRQKVKGIALGIGVLFLINLVRMVSLFLIGTYLPGVFDTTHYIIWQSLMILLAIGIWLFWMEKIVNVTPQ